MANYNDKVQGFVESLSDFWLLYFKEIDQLKVLYQGTEILVGQAYLDMLSLLLNNSVQDTPLFNKELFKLITIKEVDIRFLQRANPESNRYTYVLPDGVVSANALHNKILSITGSLDRDVDYEVDRDLRVFQFHYDPLNVYIQRVFGSNNSAFTVRTRDPLLRNFSIQLLDSGVTPTAFSLNITGTELVISYDGPANTATASARSIVQAINTHPEYAGLLYADLPVTDGGLGSPKGTTLLPLLRVDVSPLDDFATRILQTYFGGKLTASRVPDWTLTAVEKGDILRLVSGPTLATAQERDIALIRKDALYVSPDVAITDIAASDSVAFSILREPENNQSVDEYIPQPASPVQGNTDGVIDAGARTLTSVAASFSALHAGDIIELTGVLNTGYVRIVQVISYTVVELASATLVAESGVTWSLLSTMSPAVILLDGALVLNGDGSVSFKTLTLLTFLATTPCVGSVIRVYRGGVIEKYAIIDRMSNTEVLVDAPDVVVGSSLVWGWARYFVPPVTLVFDYVKAGTVLVVARREVDEQAVVEGRDYYVDEDNALLVPTTVWRTDTGVRVSYEYRLVIQKYTDTLQSGTNGSLFYGSPSTFSAPTANFTYNDIGQALRISSGSLLNPTNHGTYIIASVISATTVTLSNVRLVSSTLETGNGSLVWTEDHRGTFETEAVTALVREVAFWAPDTLVDRYHLYNTYGYLINRFENSSEAYRALIRGIFQLFMLGPTLERFESAITTVAGLAVVRDSGEILLQYLTNALQSGIDGYPAVDRTFTISTPLFTASDVSSYVYIANGLNENKLFKVIGVLSATQLLLEETPSSDGPVTWELTRTAVHQVVTSKRTYTFPRTIGLRTAVVDPANVGVTIFSAFEVLTDAFTVTDYVENPTWWARAQIPAELWENEDATRRQSSPALFENIIGPADDARIGDPGFIIGADSLGFVPPSTVKYTDLGASDGVLEGDYAHPFSNNVYFNSTVNTLFTASDIGNVLVVNSQRYRITEQLTTQRVKLEAFTRVFNASGLAWSVETQAVALRHKAAFVVLDTWLKYHLFSVTFNASLFGQVSPTLITDLQELVFTAKPSYTYVILSPSSLFKEILKATETLTNTTTDYISGDAGEVMSANASPLLIGSGWRIGTWFRYVSNAGTFSAPAVSVPNVLGVPAAGYAHYISKFSLASGDFTSGSQPIPASGFVEVLGSSGINAVITYTDSSTYTITVPAAGPFTDLHVGAMLRVYKLGSVYNGDFFIGRVLSTTQVIGSLPYGLAVLPEMSRPTVGDNALTWQIVTNGSSLGYIRNSAAGECLFTDTTGLHKFDPAHVGTYLRFAFVSKGLNTWFPGAPLTDTFNQTFRINYVAAANSADCKLAWLSRVHPIESDPDETGAVTGNTLTAPFAFFTPDMCRTNRAGLDPTTELTDQYFIVFTSGANSGQRRRLETYTSATQVVLQGAVLTTDLAVDYYIEKERAPEVATETSIWEHLRNLIVIDENTIDLSATPTQDVDPAVSFTAYGVREPIDPSLETFNATLGDTYYTLGMPDPRPVQGRSRSGHDADLREDPIQIKVT